MYRMYLPQIDRRPEMKVIIDHPQLQVEMTADNSHTFVDIDLPVGADEEQLEVVALLIGRNGEPDPLYQPILLKERVHNGPQEQPDQQPEQPATEPACGQLSSDATVAGNDPTADDVPNGLDESKGDDAPSTISETAERETPEAGEIPSVPAVRGITAQCQTHNAIRPLPQA